MCKALKNSKALLSTNIPDGLYYELTYNGEKDEIYVSTGSSCSSKLATPEKTIYAISKSNERATSTVRISLSFLTTYQEIDTLVNALNNIINGVK